MISKFLYTRFLRANLFSFNTEIIFYFLKHVTQYNKLESEKIELKRRRNKLVRRGLEIARELHYLESHPSEWMELDFREYGSVPDCILSMVALAGRGIIMCS